MKNIILSRKGFDSSAGGVASPIFDNGNIFSIPIPQKSPSPHKYKALFFNGISGKDLLKESSAKSVTSESYCHFWTSKFITNRIKKTTCKHGRLIFIFWLV